MALVEVGRRTVGDFGILKLDEINDPLMLSVSAWTHVQIWLVLRQLDPNSYKNLEWNPDQSVYGRCTIAASEDLGDTNPPILKDILMRYQIQLVYEWQNDAALTNFLIQCGTQKILTSITNLGSALGLQPVLVSDLPECKRGICPASIVRVNCDRAHIIDIVVLAENAFALLDPQMDICNDYIPIPESDNVPRPGNPDNSLTPASDPPSPGALPDPPYDPPTGDDGETPQPPVTEPLPGQLAKVVFNSTVSTCQSRDPYPIVGEVLGYQTPCTAEWVSTNPCQDGTAAYDLKVTHGGANFAYPITGVVQKPTYTIVYYTP